ncbi:signal peptidase I [Haloferax prahovense]|uniref:signal peptidase I n=1 Tax=Haloferax prahovense TaxID=381852 RepID=UPI000678EBA8|nr:signal peptidase I [Haloferax prahovense]
MKLSDVLEYAVLGFLVLAVVALLFGQALGQPVLLGYVETGSMSPTMESGDGFIAVPSVFLEDPESGDVVVFNARELHGGGLTTHRVVRWTEEGYITRGDANPFTDQESVEPPVKRSQIVAEALQVNGNVVVIPQLGAVVGAVNGLATGAFDLLGSLPGFESAADGEPSPMFLVAIGGILIALSLVFDGSGGGRKQSSHSRRRPDYYTSGVVLFLLVVIVVTPATLSMVLGSGPTELTIVSSESPNENPLVVGVGETATVDYRLTNNGYVPVITVVESRDPGVSFGQSVFVVPGKGSKNTTLTIEAPDRTGAYDREIREQLYVPALPQTVILGLHEVHPFLAIAAIDAVLAFVTLFVSVLALGLGPIRLRSTGRNVSLVEQFRRKYL